MKTPKCCSSIMSCFFPKYNYVCVFYLVIALLYTSAYDKYSWEEKLNKKNILQQTVHQTGVGRERKFMVWTHLGFTTQHRNYKLCFFNHIFYCMLLLMLNSAWAEQNCKLCLDLSLWAVLPSSLSMVSSQALSLLIAGFLIFGINCLCFSCWQSRFSWTSSRQQNVDKACTFFQENSTLFLLV